MHGISVPFASVVLISDYAQLSVVEAILMLSADGSLGRRRAQSFGMGEGTHTYAQASSQHHQLLTGSSCHVAAACMWHQTLLEWKF